MLTRTVKQSNIIVEYIKPLNFKRSKTVSITPKQPN